MEVAPANQYASTGDCVMSWTEIINLGPWRQQSGSGSSVEGWFDVIDDHVVLLNANGDPVDSREWRRELKPEDDKRRGCTKDPARVEYAAAAARQSIIRASDRARTSWGMVMQPHHAKCGIF